MDNAKHRWNVALPSRRAVRWRGGARPARWLGGVIGLALAVTCAPDIRPWLRTPTQRAVLFAGLPSYASLAEVNKRLPLGPRRAEQRHRGHSKGCLSRSFRYRVRVLTVADASHLGCTGKLELTFLNDKLVKTTFQASRGAVYLERLIARTPLALPPGGSKRTLRLTGAPPHTRVEAIGAPGRRRITWADTRLIKAYWEVLSRGSSRYMK